MSNSLPLPSEYSPRTINELLLDRANQYPNKLGFVGKFHDGEYHSVTYLEWIRLTDKLAGSLYHMFGVKKGSKVAWVLDNRNGGEAVLLYHAVLKLGAINVPINPRLTTTEIKYILEHSEADLCFFSIDSKHVMQAIEAMSIKTIPIVIGDETIQSNTSNWDEVMKDPGFTPPVIDIQSEDDANLLYTSGTTGHPKGVLHTHGSSIAAGIGWCDALRMRQQDVNQTPFPIFVGGCLHFNGLAILWAGGTFVIDDYQTESSLMLMDKYRTTVYVAVPSIYQYILESPILEDVDLSCLRILDYGGASMAPSIIKRMQEVFPNTGLVQSYGLTEAGPGGLYLSEDYALSKLGSVGNRGMYRHMHFRVVDENGNDVGPDTIGEFILRGPSIMKEYYKNPEATANALRDGWLYTGDLVKMDADGFVYHIDRKKDIVVRGGYNISSAEVEAALLDHPAVLEAAVVAKPHEKLGEDIKAFVVLRRGRNIKEAELTEFCRKKLADFKVPRDITFLSELPKSAVGKVLKRVLREDLLLKGEDL
ncbi:class I adenylate-forming enzyme family protein [Neobacillus mesonae]|uniref:class I adenylate-forming enzyme family protein n=1 Tax=Neobacillus mesonae TaxID=1193713 RepID=UPI00203C6BCF|nr:class I adenylate-forming enzyme family protein [Neobacillus mesonae]MCM3568237.1 acyl--CoA ligase [Neobacillus mesonae]